MYRQHTPDLSSPRSAADKRTEAILDVVSAIGLGVVFAGIAVLWLSV